MKTMKKMFLVLTALLMAFAWTGCSDDDKEDKSFTVTFTENKTIDFTIGETKVTGIFLSEKQTIDGDVVQFYIYINETSLSDSTGIGSWEFGLLDDEDAESEEEALCYPIYKGTFMESEDNVILTRTHIIDATATDGWKESRKVGWKKIDTSKKTFSVTFTNEDVEELEATLNL